MRCQMSGEPNSPPGHTLWGLSLWKDVENMYNNPWYPVFYGNPYYANRSFMPVYPQPDGSAPYGAGLWNSQIPISRREVIIEHNRVTITGPAGQQIAERIRNASPRCALAFLFRCPSDGVGPAQPGQMQTDGPPTPVTPGPETMPVIPMPYPPYRY